MRQQRTLFPTATAVAVAAALFLLLTLPGCRKTSDGDAPPTPAAGTGTSNGNDSLKAGGDETNAVAPPGLDPAKAGKTTVLQAD
jgi:hypothetical protein